MEPFVTHRGRVAVLDWSDVNTDLIIPARYLKKIERTGFGPLLFADKRYAPGGAPEADDPDRTRAEARRISPQQPGIRRGNRAGRRATTSAAARAASTPSGPSCRPATARSSRRARTWASPISSSPTPSKTACWSSSSTNPTGKRIAAAGTRHGRAKPRSRSTFATRRSSCTPMPEPLQSPPTAGSHFEVPESHRHRLLHGLDAIAETLLHDQAHQPPRSQQLPPWLAPRILTLIIKICKIRLALHGRVGMLRTALSVSIMPLRRSGRM